MLKVDNLNQYYSGSHILRNLSFEAPPGIIVARRTVTGPRNSSSSARWSANVVSSAIARPPYHHCRELRLRDFRRCANGGTGRPEQEPLHDDDEHEHRGV